MKPNKETIFKPISELENYSDKTKWFCTAVVFSPETENNHFDKCPPYIQINLIDNSQEAVYFKVPEIVAYYAKTHPCYTMKGIENHIKEGERKMAQKIKDLLNL